MWMMLLHLQVNLYADDADTTSMLDHAWALAGSSSIYLLILIYILCHPHRAVYIGSWACVVKDAVKCSFEYLSVVHHSCCKHSVGVGDEEMIK